MELLKNLGFVKITEETKLDNEQQKNMDIPDAHQKLVMDRFNKVRKYPHRLLGWDDAKKDLKP